MGNDDEKTKKNGGESTPEQQEETRRRKESDDAMAVAEEGAKVDLVSEMTKKDEGSGEPREETFVKKYQGGIDMLNNNENILDQMMSDIRLTGINPTKEQIKNIMNWLEQRIENVNDFPLPHDLAEMYERNPGYMMNPYEEILYTYKRQYSDFCSLVDEKPRLLVKQMKEHQKERGIRRGKEVEKNYLSSLDKWKIEKSRGFNVRDRLEVIEHLIDQLEGDGNIGRSELKKVELGEKTKLEYLILLENYLLAQIRLEEDFSEAMDKSVDATGKARAARQFANAMKKAEADYKKASISVGADQKQWEIEMVEKGLLRPVETTSGVRWRDVDGSREELKQAIIDKAVEKNNNDMYAISDEERELEGDEWTSLVETKREEIIDSIKDKIRTVLESRDKNLKEKGPQMRTEYFGNVFKGMFIGKNELSLNKGETVPNIEFLGEILSDVDYINTLLRPLGNNQGDRMEPFLKRGALEQLVIIFEKSGGDSSKVFSKTLYEVAKIGVENDPYRGKHYDEELEIYRITMMRLDAFGLEGSYSELSGDPNFWEKIDFYQLADLTQLDNFDYLGDIVSEMIKSESDDKEKIQEHIKERIFNVLVPSRDSQVKEKRKKEEYDDLLGGSLRVSGVDREGLYEVVSHRLLKLGVEQGLLDYGSCMDELSRSDSKGSKEDRIKATEFVKRFFPEDAAAVEATQVEFRANGIDLGALTPEQMAAAITAINGAK